MSWLVFALVFWIGAWALIAALHNPSGGGRWFYGLMVTLGCAVGAGIAGRHVWLQNLPADQVPDCGMGLNYMLDTMPVLDVLREVFYGAGECAEVLWTFFGISIPGWSLIWFAFYTLATIFVLVSFKQETVRG